MKKTIDWKNLTTEELAGLIFQHLKQDGIEVILVGGACVTIYSNNRYVSKDLDYVTYEDSWKIKDSLKKIGFVQKGKYFHHAKCQFFIDFVQEPVAIGNEIISKFEKIKTKYGEFKLLRVADCVKDRLASFYHWNDRQGLNQAIDVCLDHKISMKEILDWSIEEGFEKKFSIFEKELKKKKMEKKTTKKRP